MSPFPVNSGQFPSSMKKFLTLNSTFLHRPCHIVYYQWYSCQYKWRYYYLNCTRYSLFFTLQWLGSLSCAAGATEPHGWSAPHSIGPDKRKYQLQKHAYSNVLKILPPKNENFQIKILIFFIFLLKTDCVYSLEWPQWGGSNEYLQIMFWAEIRKMYTPVNPSFTI